MPMLLYYHCDLTRRDGASDAVMQATGDGFSSAFCAGRRAYVISRASNLPFRDLSVSPASFTTSFFLIQSIWLSTFQFTKKHESPRRQKNQNNFFSHCSRGYQDCVRASVAVGYGLDAEAKSGGLFFKDPVIYWNIFSFQTCFFIC